MDANFTVDTHVRRDARSNIDRFIDEVFNPILIGAVVALWTLHAFHSAVAHG